MTPMQTVKLLHAKLDQPDRQPTGVQRAPGRFRGINLPDRKPTGAVENGDPKLNPGPKLDQPDRQPTGLFQDMAPDGRKDGRKDGRTDGRTTPKQYPSAYE
ncbi:hypothetical protein DPMN_133298 [Dreissena polymorpha]|uniref:Uncharacterized protein n=1 Tax=Dreissena polymorpha TaxID=45954 RepID=A0A9D4FVB6_DREPO|nr:hypothetical protein DPMN_133298 [Dreissena polymorpha]